MILPITLVANSLGIVANISDRVQIDKLAGFLKSSITWFLGFVIVAFITILSVQGTLTSNVDGVASRTVRSAVSTFVPVVR